MDYLVNEGYPIAAKKFAVEANIPPPSVSAETIQERVEIRNAILGGQIQTAIEKINDLNPQVPPLQKCLHIFPAFFCMIRSCFMHHSYDPSHSATGVDEKPNTFSPQYDHRTQTYAIEPNTAFAVQC